MTFDPIVRARCTSDGYPLLNTCLGGKAICGAPCELVKRATAATTQSWWSTSFRREHIGQWVLGLISGFLLLSATQICGTVTGFSSDLQAIKIAQSGLAATQISQDGRLSRIEAALNRFFAPSRVTEGMP